LRTKIEHVGSNEPFQTNGAAQRRKEMQLFPRSLVAAILTAGWYLFIPTVNVLAQAPSPGPSISARDLSDQKLKAVAAALQRVASLRKDYEQRIVEAEAPAEKERIVAEANKELPKAVTEQGLSVEEYSAILDAARDDPEVRDRLFQHVRPSDK
jgi:regulator of protease activity HflC (stomatin/prohibitin superfamily)